MAESIPKHVFDLLACPICKKDLRYGKDKKTLVCADCEESYPIKDGVLVLLPKD